MKLKRSCLCVRFGLVGGVGESSEAVGALVGGAVTVVEDAVHATAASATVKVQEFGWAKACTAVLAFGKRALAVREEGREEAAAVVTTFFRVRLHRSTPPPIRREQGLAPHSA